jgi:hypothetical protein
MHTKFWLESLKRRDHTEDLDVDENVILEWILGKYRVEDVDQCQDIVNTVMNIQVP